MIDFEYYVKNHSKNAHTGPVEGKPNHLSLNVLKLSYSLTECVRSPFLLPRKCLRFVNFLAVKERSGARAR